MKFKSGDVIIATSTGSIFKILKVNEFYGRYLIERDPRDTWNEIELVDKACSLYVEPNEIMKEIL